MTRRTLSALAALPLALYCVCEVQPVTRATAWPNNYASLALPTHTVTLASATNVPTSGGNLFINGSGFQLPMAMARVSGAWLPFPTTATTGTTAMTATVPTLSAGTYDLLVADQDGSMSLVAFGALSVVSTLTPSAIYGANLSAQYICEHALCSGSCGAGPYVGNCTTGATVTHLCDETGNGNHLNVVGGVVYNAASSHFRMSNIATVATNGSTGVLFNPAFSIGSSHALYLLGDFYAAAPTSVGWFGAYGASVGSTMQPSGAVGVSVNGSLNANSATTYGSMAFAYYGGDTSTSPTSHALDVAVNNGAHVTNSGTPGGSFSTGGYYSIGGAYTGSSISNAIAVEFAEIDIINVASTGTQLGQYVNYLNLTDGVTAPPSIKGVTVVQASTASAPGRIHASGLMPGATATVGGGVGALTTINTIPVAMDFQAPSTVAGSYNLTVVNPDGQGDTQINAFQVAAVTTPETIFGPPLVAWYEDSVTLNGTTVSAWLDKSMLGNDELQATSLDQPTFNVSDSDFLGHPSLTAGGSPVSLLSATFNLSQTCTAWYKFWVLKLATTTGSPWADAFTTGAVPSTIIASGVPESAYLGANVQAWSGSIGTSVAYVMQGLDNAAADGGTGNYFGNVSVNGATALRSSGTSGAGSYATATPLTLFEAYNNTNYLNAKAAFFAMVCAVPTGPQLSALNTYVQKFGAGL